MTAAYQRKVKTYGPFAAELQEQRVRYRPIVWSCYGRPHFEVGDALRRLARAAARRRGFPEWRLLHQRVSAAISVELQRRLVAQVRRCIQAASPLEVAFGEAVSKRTRVPQAEENAVEAPSLEATAGAARSSAGGGGATAA